ncbi:MAG: metallophosphoesterase family protein [Myxococcales bacterium]
MKILHLSDLHFQAEYPVKRWPRLGWRRIAAQAEFRLLRRRLLFLRVAEVVASILEAAERLGVEHIVVSGDLTALALPEEFEAARAALTPWLGRMTVVPGNHDRYTPAAARERAFEKAFAPALSSDLPELCREDVFPVVKLIGEEVAVIGLNSARVPPVPGLAAGFVGRAQREALVEISRHPALRGRALLLAVHHAPLRPSGWPDLPTHGLLDGRRVLALAAAAGAVALCHGHIHQRYRLAGPGRLGIFCAGSSTEAGMEGYWLFDVDRSGLHSAQAIRITPPL